MRDKTKIILLILLCCFCLTSCKKDATAEATVKAKESALADAAGGQELFNSLPGIQQALLNIGELFGITKGAKYHEKQVAKAKTELTAAKMEAGVLSAGVSRDQLSWLKKNWWIILLVLIAIIAIIILLLKKKPGLRLKPKAKPAPAAFAPLAPTHAVVKTSEYRSSKAPTYTEEQVRAMCREKGKDYDQLIHLCGSVDAAGHYLTTGTMGNTVW